MIARMVLADLPKFKEMDVLQNSRPFIIYIMVCEENWFDLSQERIKNACKIAIFLGKVLVVQKKVVPLHPQIRNTT